MKDIVDSNSRDENIKGCQELRTRVKNWNDKNQFKLISKRQRLRNNDPSVFNFLAELGKLWSKKYDELLFLPIEWLGLLGSTGSHQPARLPTVRLEDCGDGGVDIERKLHCAPVINFRQIVMEGREGEVVLWLVTFFILCHRAPSTSLHFSISFRVSRHYVKHSDCWHCAALCSLTVVAKIMRGDDDWRFPDLDRKWILRVWSWSWSV